MPQSKQLAVSSFGGIAASKETSRRKEIQSNRQNYPLAAITSSIMYQHMTGQRVRVKHILALIRSPPLSLSAVTAFNLEHPV